MGSTTGLVAVVPALNEEGSIVAVVAGLLARGVSVVVVADNGSVDRTAQVSRSAGARVVSARRRGYGSACLAALESLPSEARAVVFCDADGADDLDRLAAICEPVLSDTADLVVGSRTLGQPERGALTTLQRVGNTIAAGAMRLLFRQVVTDLGPFRCVSTAALARLGMSDPGYGWTAEMQAKVLGLGLRYREVPVMARTRRAGQSKISGRLVPSLRAGVAILTTILRCRISRPASKASNPKSEGGQRPSGSC